MPVLLGKKKSRSKTIDKEQGWKWYCVAMLAQWLNNDFWEIQSWEWERNHATKDTVSKTISDKSLEIWTDVFKRHTHQFMDRTGYKSVACTFWRPQMSGTLYTPYHFLFVRQCAVFSLQWPWLAEEVFLRPKNTMLIENGSVGRGPNRGWSHTGIGGGGVWHRGLLHISISRQITSPHT